jgi:hypothetical protein
LGLTLGDLAHILPPGDFVRFRLLDRDTETLLALLPLLPGLPNSVQLLEPLFVRPEKFLEGVATVLSPSDALDVTKFLLVLSHSMLVSENRLLVLLGLSEDLERACRFIATSDDTAFGLGISDDRRPLGRSEVPARLFWSSARLEALDSTKLIPSPPFSSLFAVSDGLAFKVSEGRRVLLFRRPAGRGRGLVVLL